MAYKKHTIAVYIPPIFAALLFAVLAGDIFAQQAPPPSGDQPAQQLWKLNHIRAENAERALLRILPPETVKSVVIQVKPETNEINLIGVANAVQATVQALKTIDKPPAAPYLNTETDPRFNRQFQQPPSQQSSPSQFGVTDASQNRNVAQNATSQTNITLRDATQNPNFADWGGQTPEGNEPGTYFCKPSQLQAITRELHSRFSGIAMETLPESGKILVWAPQRVHREITALMTQAGAWAEVPPGRDPREFEGTLMRFASEPRPANVPPQPVVERKHVPKYATLDQIEAKLQVLFGNRLIDMQSSDKQLKQYRVAIPRSQGTTVCELVLDYPDYQVDVKAPQNIADEMQRLLQAIDQPAPDEGRDRRFISIQNSDTEQIRKLLDVYRSKAVHDSSRLLRNNRNPNMLAYQRNGNPAYSDGRNPVRQVNYVTQDDGLGGGLGTGTGTGPAFGGGLGDGGLGGMMPGYDGTDIPGGITLIPGTESKIQVLPDLDVVIIDAPPEEVRRIMEMIDQLGELGKLAQSEIEVMLLKNVQCEALDAILKMVLRISPLTGQPVYLYDEMFSTKQGRVWVLPLHNPNAMLVVGWGQARDAMKALIEQLDRPVSSENSLLRVIKLESAPVKQVALVLNDFFAAAPAGPGVAGTGFYPRIRILEDPRTNSLIVQAAPNDYRDIERVIAELDVAQGGPKFQVKTYKMKYLLAADMVTALTDTLESAIGGTLDERMPTIDLPLDTPQGRRIINSGFLTEVKFKAVNATNTVVVTAPANCLPLIDELINMLDQSQGVAFIKVIPIQYSDAETIRKALETLIPSQTGSGGVQLPTSEEGDTFIPIKFTTDIRSNSVIVAGAENDIFFIETLIKSLDKQDALQRETKIFQLRNTGASDVSKAIMSYLDRRREMQADEIISPYQRLQSAAIVVPEPIANVLIVSAADQYMAEIEKMIKDLDQEPPQVMVQVLIAEVSLGSADEFGIELGLQDPLLFSRSSVVTPTSGGSDELKPGYNFNDPSTGLGNSASPESLATAGTVATQMLSSFSTGRVNSDSGFGGLIFSASSDAVSVLIRAMQERTRVEILSRPQITAQDNQLAIIFVGQKVLRSKGSQTNNGVITSNAEDEDVGLFLGVIPRISKSDKDADPDKIVMLISASKSSLGAASDGMTTVVSGNLVRTPNINQARTETIVSAQDGETVLLGGLISTDKQEICRGVPYLSNVPVLGNLFKYEYEKLKRSELIIIMRPRIIRNSQDMDDIKRVEFARMNWCMADVTRLHGDIGVYNPMARQPVTGGAPSFSPAPVDMSQLQELPQPRGVNSGNAANGSTSGIVVDTVPRPATLQSTPYYPANTNAQAAPSGSTVAPAAPGIAPRTLSAPSPMTLTPSISSPSPATTTPAPGTLPPPAGY